MNLKTQNQFKKDHSNRQERKHYDLPELNVHVDFSPNERDVLNKVKAKAIVKAMELSNNNRTKAGKILGMAPRSIRYFLEKFTKEKANENLPG